MNLYIKISKVDLNQNNKKFLECVQHNSQNSYIKNIFIYTDCKEYRTTIRNVKIIFKEKLADYFIMSQSKFTKGTIIYSNPFIKFGEDLFKISENELNKYILLNKDYKIYLNDIKIIQNDGEIQFINKEEKSIRLSCLSTGIMSVINDSQSIIKKPTVIKKTNDVNDSNPFKFLINGKRVVFVGPGTSLENIGMGKFIDTFDIVVRMNSSYDIPTGNQMDYGSRCDILYVSSVFHKNNLLTIKNTNHIKLICSTIKYHEFSGKNSLFDVSNIYEGKKLLTGLYVMQDILSMEPNELHITGMDFYKSEVKHVNFYKIGDLHTDENVKKTISKFHDVEHDLVFFKENIANKSNVTLDKMLNEITKTNENRQVIIHNKSNKDVETTSVVRYDISKLNLSSGESLNKNYALCTICDDKFIPGLLTMIHSFTRHNRWFNKEIIVLYDNVYSKINDDNKKLVNQLYNKVVFRKVESEDYSKLIELFKSSSNGRESILRLIPSLFTFDIFEISDNYDTLVYLDADMLVTDDISELFSIGDVSIVVTPDAGEYDINRIYTVFNGGFMVINTDGDMSKHKQRLIEYACNMKSMVLADQTIMNKYFDNKNIVYLNSNYNCLKRCFPDTRFDTYIKNIKIIHFVGAKPWISSTLTRELVYKKLEQMWFNEYSIIHTQAEIKQSTETKAIFIHLYYQDIWTEIKNRLVLLTFDYDLYVSICSEHADEVSNDVFKFKKNAIVTSVENRGADYGGFFELLNISFDNNSEYDWILKIHGKKSELVNPVKGERWRKELINTLIPNNFEIINNKMLDNSIGMIGVKSYLMSQTSSDTRAGKSVNQENIDEFRARYDISDNTLKFFAGSMFWIKYDILKSTFDADRITQYDFGKGHALDGTKAHAMERFMANLVRENNLNVIGI